MGAKLLLDSPAAKPALGFEQIASAFAQIIESSEPRFAIGIFGGWGSGKTTLMDAISEHLTSTRTIAVRFNAWRFEREQELLIPLLDAIRDGLVQWAKQQEVPEAAGERARKTAGRIARVARALLSGVSVEVGLSAVAKVSYDAGAVKELTAGAEDEAQPQSLYFAGFAELSSAFEEFSPGGIERIVVFVDDLDRCLPSNALDVLEAMKLFFDLPGFVFVVGLDEQIVERAVLSRFADVAAVSPAAGAGPAADGARPRTGSEYVKKLFQVPYALPQMLAGQLDELLRAMYDEASLDHDQLDDLRKRVMRYLRYVARDDLVNPREVKRFINAYTLQTLVRPELNRDVVLSLQTIVFRSDWDVAYDLLETDSELFKAAVRSHRDGVKGALEDIWPPGAVVPAEFAEYARSSEFDALVACPTLEPYLFSLRSATSSTWLGDAYSAVGAIRRRARQLREEPNAGAPAIRKRFAGEIRELADRLGRMVSGNVDPMWGEPLQAALKSLGRAVAGLDEEDPMIPGSTDVVVKRAADAIDEQVALIQQQLRLIRRRSLVQPLA